MATPQDAQEPKIHSSCPQCGGEVAWSLWDRTTLCTFCDSVLARVGASAADMFVGEDRVRGAADLQRILRSSARIGRVTVKEYHRVYAPYLLVAMNLVFHALGRSFQEHKAKMCRSLFFQFEDIHPAYPVEWDFRDAGLWVPSQRLVPLSKKHFGDGALIPFEERRVDLDEITRRWTRNRRLIQPEMEPVHIRGDRTRVRSFCVYRPYHLVRAKKWFRSGWYLVDGRFGTVAGTLRTGEVKRFLQGDWPRLQPSDMRPPEVRSMPHRCPQCAGDLEYSPHALYFLCEECGRLLRPTGEGLRETPYRTAEGSPPPSEDGPVAWLPYWKVDGAWELNGRKHARPMDLIRDILPIPEELAKRLPLAWRSAYLPAFDVWTVSPYDETAFALAGDLCAAEPPCPEGRLYHHVSVRATDAVILPSVEESAPRDLFPHILGQLLPVALQRRMTTAVLQTLQSAVFHPSAQTLVYAPAPLGVNDEGRRQVVTPHGRLDLDFLRSGEFPFHLRRSVRAQWMRSKGMQKR